MATISTIFKLVASVSGTNNVRTLKNEVDKVSTSGQRLSRTFNSVGLALRNGAYLFAATKIVNVSDKYTMLEARVRGIGKTASETARLMKELQDISFETGTKMEASVNILQRISFVRNEIKATNTEMLSFVQTVSKLGVISGATPDAMRFGLTQLGQSLSAQVMRAEEFNSIMENIPAVGNAIAKEFGITTGQLRLLVLEGQVLSKDVFAALLNQSQDVNKQFKDMPRTVGMAFSAATTSAGLLLSTLMGESGTTGGIVAIIDKVNDGLRETKGLFVDLKKLANKLGSEFKRLYPEQQKTSFDPFSADLKTLYKAFTRKPDKMTAAPSSFMLGGAPKTMSTANATPVPQGAFKTKIETDYVKLAADLAAKGSKVKKTPEEKAAETAAKQASRKIADTNEDLQKKIATLNADTAAIRLNNDAKEKSVTLAEFEARGISKASNEYKKLSEAIDENNRAHKSFEAGAFEAINSYMDGINNMAASTSNVLTSAFKGMEDSLVEFVATGKLKFADFANSIVRDLIRMQVQQSITGPLVSLLGNFMGSFAPGGGGVSASSIVWEHANGGIMTDRGSLPLNKYANGGIANSPQMAMFGEGRNPEAYVPLPDGRSIPVTMKGNGGSQQNNVSVVVNMNGGDQITGSGDKAKALGNSIAATVKSILVNEKRPGGLLAT